MAKMNSNMALKIFWDLIEVYYLLEVCIYGQYTPSWPKIQLQIIKFEKKMEKIENLTFFH